MKCILWLVLPTRTTYHGSICLFRQAYKKIDQAGITKMCRIGESGEEECETADYNNAWKHATELDTMYIKIDDDIVSSAYWYFLPIL